MTKRSDPVKFLQKADPVLAEVIKRVPRPEWQPSGEHFLRLVKEIINQQLSDKASATITERFLKLFPDGVVKPKLVLKLSDEHIRQSGISYAKVSYIKDLASKTLAGKLDFEKIRKLSDAAVMEHLIQVKGIGRWTAEMFLMFSLGREDVFSYGDQGLKNAIKRLYRLKKHPTPRQAEKISSKWRPYRTWACRYLWASLDL